MPSGLRNARLPPCDHMRVNEHSDGQQHDQHPGYQQPEYPPLSGHLPAHQPPSSQPPVYQPPGYQQPVYQQPGYPQPGYQQPSYPAMAGYSSDPAAPFGRDPITGEPLSDKSKVAAGLLQLFLGGLGVGRFYLGYGAIGGVQLALTIVGWITLFFFIGIIILAGVGIWVLVDAIMILTGSVKDSRGLKLRS